VHKESLPTEKEEKEKEIINESKGAPSFLCHKWAEVEYTCHPSNAC